MNGKRIDRRWILGGIIVYVISVSLCYLLVLRPMAAQVKRAEMGKVLLEDYYVLQETRKAIDMFEGRLATDFGEDELREIAGACGVALESVAMDSARTLNATLDSVPFRMLFRSDYHQIGSLLARLEGTETFLAVDDLRIAVGLNGDQGHQAECTVYAFRTSR